MKFNRILKDRVAAQICVPYLLARYSFSFPATFSTAYTLERRSFFCSMLKAAGYSKAGCVM
jgi:hypothetical protein